MAGLGLLLARRRLRQKKKEAQAGWRTGHNGKSWSGGGTVDCEIGRREARRNRMQNVGRNVEVQSYGGDKRRDGESITQNGEFARDEEGLGVHFVDVDLSI